MPVLDSLDQARAEPHDPPRLEARRNADLKALYAKLPYQPSLTSRMQRWFDAPWQLKPMDADELVDAAASVIGWTGHDLSDDLQAVTLLVARLGGISAAFRIGLLAMEELQALTARSEDRLG